MSAASFLQDLAVVLTMAACALWVFQKLGQPPVLGYLAVGLIVGPHTPPMTLVRDLRSLEALAEAGVVFLLFALGAEFNLARLARMGIKPLICAFLEAFLLVTFGWWTGTLLGWGTAPSLLFGGVIAVASTAIVARTLLKNAAHPAGWEELVAGTLIAEDMIAVLLIALVSSSGRWEGGGLSAILPVILRFAIVVTLVLVTGLLVFPRVLRQAERARMEEVRTLLTVGICFGVALLTEKLGFSAALGAFLAGATASAGGSSARLHETVTPFREVFGAVFFVSVGMLIDPRWIVENWEMAAGLALAAVAARFLANFVAVTAAGEERAGAVQASLAMLPIGEFSFILAQLGQRQGLGPQAYPLAVTLCLAMTLTSSLLLPPALASPDGVRRLFPRALGKLLDEYRSALKRLAMPARAGQAWRLTRPSLVQMVLNAVGIAALFLGAGAARDRWLPVETWPGLAWGLAAFASLPFLLALIRKSQAVALILLEAAATHSPDDAPPGEARPVLTRLVFALAAGIVAWWYLALGWSLLPPWPYAAVPLALFAVLGGVLWRRMNAFYSRLQFELRESLAGSEADPELAPAALAYSVGTAAAAPDRLRVVAHRLHKAWGAGKTLKDLGLRAACGASIIQINRGAHPLPAPGPEARLQEGDEVVLIGQPDQLAKARRFLDSGPARA